MSGPQAGDPAGRGRPGSWRAGADERAGAPDPDEELPGPVNGSAGGGVEELAGKAAGQEPAQARPDGGLAGSSGQCGARRVAAIDCGTNSLRLLIADIDPAGPALTDVVRRMEIVRLGQGVDATGRLAPDALARTMGVLAGYQESIRQAGATAIRMVATSATRDASNAADFTRGVVGILGIEPEVITGEEEARLSFAGATAELGAGIAAPPYLVVDIGGGSTEFVVRPAAARPGSGGTGGTGSGGTGSGGELPAAADLAAVSVNIGCVRLTERHLRSDPADAAEIRAAISDIDAALETAAVSVPVASARSLVGVAGSVTTVAAIALGLTHYDPARTHHARLSGELVHEVTRALLSQTREQRAAIGSLHPGRVDVIGAGALVLDRIMTRFGFTSVVVSEHDLLDGIAWSVAAGDGS